jgi:hypothetical protein
VDVGGVELGVAGGANRPDGFTLGHAVALDDADGAEVEQRDREAVVGQDRDRAPVPGQPAREGDTTGARRRDRGSGLAADVDPRVTALVVLRAAEVESA